MTSPDATAVRSGLSTLSRAHFSVLLAELGAFGCALRYRPPGPDIDFDEEPQEEAWEVYQIRPGYGLEAWFVGEAPTPLTACVNALITLLGYEDGSCVTEPEEFNLGELERAVAVARDFLKTHLPGPEAA